MRQKSLAAVSSLTPKFIPTQTDGSGDLTSEAIEKSLHSSLQRLKKSDGVGPTLTFICALEEFF